MPLLDIWLHSHLTHCIRRACSLGVGLVLLKLCIPPPSSPRPSKDFICWCVWNRHLVKFEFDEIKLSRWEASFQSIASYQKQEAGQFPTRIFFGANDHWVDNELRDAFIYKYCDPSGPLAFGKEGLDLQARIDPSRDGDEESVVIPHDFSIGMSIHSFSSF